MTCPLYSSLEWWCRQQLSATDSEEMICAVFPSITSPWALSTPSAWIFFYCLAAVRVILIFFFHCFHDPSDLRGGVEMLTQPRTPGDLSIRCRAVGQSLTQSRLIGCRRLSAVDLLLLHSRLTLDKKRELTFG